MSDTKIFSIILPASKNEVNFSLLKKLKNKFPKCEIILSIDSENELSIETLSEINLNINKLVKVTNSTRAKSLNMGAAMAENDYFWFLHIDSNIDDLEQSDLNKLKDNQLGYFKLAFDRKENKINASGANFRSKNFDLPFGDQSFLINKNLFNLVGCFDESLKEGEDHKLVWDAKALGVEIKEISKKITSSARKYKNNSLWQTVKTLFKTVLQVKKFKQNKIENIYCFFMKDPFSKNSKSRLRNTLKNDQLVDDFNMHCLKIVKSNIEVIAKKKENKIVIINNSQNNNYLEKLDLKKFSIVNFDYEDVGKSMQATYNLCAKFSDNLVLIGSDIPELNFKHLEEAISHLNKFDTFLIPTNDNGFCCFSTKLKTLTNIFTQINYNSDDVLNDLTQNLYNYHKSDYSLIDVDTLNDLQKMYSRLEKNKTINQSQIDLVKFIDKRKYL